MNSTAPKGRRPLTVWGVQLVLLLFAGFLTFIIVWVLIEEGLQKTTDLSVVKQDPETVIRRIFGIAFLLGTFASFIGIWFRAKWSRWLAIVILSSFLISVGFNMAIDWEFAAEFNANDTIEMIGFLIGMGIILFPLTAALLALILSRKLRKYFSSATAENGDSVTPPPPPEFEH